MVDISNVKLGKKKAVLDPSTPKLTNIVNLSITDIPKNLNWINGVSWPMWKNNTIGCCTQVSVASALRVWSHNTSSDILLTDANVIKNYSDESGYNPSNPNSDQGAIETDVLNRWIHTGYITPSGINKLSMFGYLNPKDIECIKKGIILFGGVYIGMELPQYALQTNSPVWTLNDTNNQIVGGHAMFIHGYDDNFLYLNTWGSEWQMTWDFFTTYCDEAYGLVSQVWMNNSNNSPFGENIDKLKQELTNLAH